jgi:hypothetical protein
VGDKFGDLSRMDRLVANLGRLARVPAAASPAVSEWIAAAIEGQFEAGVDSYGDAWEALADSTVARGRHAPPLTDKRDMRRSVRAFPLPGAGVAITIDHPAQVHQTGWEGPKSSGPARPVLPGEHFPAAWADAIGDLVAEYVNGTLQEAV